MTVVTAGVATCSHPDGCPRQVSCRDLCAGHYRRWSETGELGPVEFRPYRTESCSVDDCGKPHHIRGFCTKHYQRWRKTGDPSTAAPQYPTGAAHPLWKGDDVGYIAVHHRLRRRRGPASGHLCVGCGGQAAQWSYTHDCPNERRDPKRGPYSADPSRYVPRCNSCHTLFDLEASR